jgi:hypothetical protein
MSRTYHIVCFETKKSIWIGQGKSLNDFYLYVKELGTMAELEQFLKDHFNKPLYFVDSEVVCDLFSMPDEQIKQIIENGL